MTKEERIAYENGLKKAWEYARKIGNNNQLGLEKQGFDFSKMKPEEGWNPSWWIINNYTASEAIAIIEGQEE